MDKPLSPRVASVIKALFAQEEHQTVIEMLVEECGAARLYVTNANLVERVQLAVLKISNGQIDKFLAATQLAQIDWRDALMTAGFGQDVNVHLRWAQEVSK